MRMRAGMCDCIGVRVCVFSRAIVCADRIWEFGISFASQLALYSLSAPLFEPPSTLDMDARFPQTGAHS